MQHARLYLFRLADVPEVFAEISARAAGYVHLALVFVVADGAFPLVIVVDDNFAVESADLAIVGLGVEFGVLDVIVNKLDDVFESRKVVAHVGNFDVGYCAAGRNFLELAFKLEFVKCVDMLANMNMI